MTWPFGKGKDRTLRRGRYLHVKVRERCQCVRVTKEERGWIGSQLGDAYDDEFDGDTVRKSVDGFQWMKDDGGREKRKESSTEIEGERGK